MCGLCLTVIFDINWCKSTHAVTRSRLTGVFHPVLALVRCIHNGLGWTPVLHCSCAEPCWSVVYGFEASWIILACSEVRLSQKRYIRCHRQCHLVSLRGHHRPMDIGGLGSHGHHLWTAEPGGREASSRVSAFGSAAGNFHVAAIVLHQLRI